jgi:4-alpha-glucanotransferase
VSPHLTLPHSLVREARSVLGIDRLVLAVHDASLPHAPGEDTGRGSLYGRGGEAFLRFARDLGFCGVQLGPMGLTGRGNASPYDGAASSRNPLSIDLFALCEDDAFSPWLGRALAEDAARDLPPGAAARVPYLHVFDARARAMELLHASFNRARASGDAAREVSMALRNFREEAGPWLLADALYEILSREHGHGDFRCWPSELDRLLMSPPAGREAESGARIQELADRHAAEIERHALVQLVGERQHRHARAVAAGLGLALYGDLQIGVSLSDRWRTQHVFLQGYRMGAPPSRTNPEGQPWGYPVLDPEQLHEGGAAHASFVERVERLLGDFDAIRVDHPHGFVCPWVYREDAPDPFAAIRRGARLLSSPHLPDHPSLARFAIPRADQLTDDPLTPRHADGWVTSLDEAQVARYAVLIDAAVASASRRGLGAGAVLCEVLSTLPYPLARVIERHGIGRFRVTQKANPAKPSDVYRAENAGPSDWIMVGNHDTPSIWQVTDRWHARGELGDHAAYLASRLTPVGDSREKFAAELCASPARLARAKLAELFLGPARNVQIFFADLLGMRETYNAPGTVSDSNWSLRIPPDYRQEYAGALARGDAMSVPAALATALRARGAQHADLAASLDTLDAAASRSARDR